MKGKNEGDAENKTIEKEGIPSVERVKGEEQ